ncbi:MAG: sigma-54-dependent Fis family transcriptional regulator [Spirochaetes bacterium]|nr:sigma-54-dependent Fis family transcriptional regulator [Spirochaetota bacterium]
MKNILIIDDNEKLCRSLKQNFDQRSFLCSYANTPEEAIHEIQTKNYDLVYLDIVFGDADGIELLEEILKIKPDLPVIMITGFAKIESAVQAIKIGAHDYIQKPLNFEKLLKITENAIKIKVLENDNKNYRDYIESLAPKLVTRNQNVISLYEKAMRLAPTDISILIQGENGTGKEVLADFIHSNSNCRNKQMIKINCAAFPENLLDNELFGHEKGSYTGASSAYKGVFERANGSTLMLDEIGDMDLSTQAKILRAVQNKEIQRIGGSSPIHINVRFIAATNKDISRMIDENSFRNDLYYRLNSATLVLPPLRERKEDLPLLIDYFLNDLNKTTMKHIEGVTDNVLEIFYNYDWPGNIRELRNTIMYGAALASDKRIRRQDLPPVFENDFIKINDESPFNESEKNIILKTLKKTDYNKKRAAELLNISRRTLYNKIEKYGIPV